MESRLLPSREYKRRKIFSRHLPANRKPAIATHFSPAKRAKKGMRSCQIFDETANQEKEHAKRLFKFLTGGDVEITAAFPAGMMGRQRRIYARLPAASSTNGVSCILLLRKRRARKGLRPSPKLFRIHCRRRETARTALFRSCREYRSRHCLREGHFSRLALPQLWLYP